jgi:hypothetical protein
VWKASTKSDDKRHSKLQCNTDMPAKFEHRKKDRTNELHSERKKFKRDRSEQTSRKSDENTEGINRSGSER